MKKKNERHFHSQEVLLNPSLKLFSSIRTTSSSTLSPSTTILDQQKEEEREKNDYVAEAEQLKLKEEEDGFFASSDTTFESIGIQSPVLLNRLQNLLGLKRPSAIQQAAFLPILEGRDVTVGAETGSGKTLAYLLPLIDQILQQKQKQQQQQNDDDETIKKKRSILESDEFDYCRALILVPNKELVRQVVRMAIPLCGGTFQDASDIIIESSGRVFMTPIRNESRTFQLEERQDEEADAVDPSTLIRLAVMPGGLATPQDFQPFRTTSSGKEPRVDIVISTPAAVGPLGLSPKNIGMFSDIPTLVIDEADMLLDGGYIKSLEQVLMGFRRADKLNRQMTQSNNEENDNHLSFKPTQHIFCAATLPDSGLKSVDAYIQRKFPYIQRISMAGMHNARHYGLCQQTQWIHVPQQGDAGNRWRMQKLISLFQDGELDGEKVMIFLNSVDDAEGVHAALNRAGISAAKYHSKISLQERGQNLDQFRRYTAKGNNHNEGDNDNAVPVLICTDLASRGLDIPGVTVVVQLQFATNAVSHLHRMGRCGRAGNCNGRGIVFHDDSQSDLVQIVRDAEVQQERMMLESQVIETMGDDDDAPKNNGTVASAFSRRRGLSKRKKKERKGKKQQPQETTAEESKTLKP